ncbi:nucleotidyltransferase family protein [Methylocystis sp.]|uniref:nucleotidyltransferase family protein n=1 Tax=Methylocystis sp. TaxID=1911079 RepID=UPI003D115BBB
MEATLQNLIVNDPIRWPVLNFVRELRLPDCWVGAGFVRNAVWDNLHGRSSSLLDGDVDVIWFDRHRASEAEDDSLEIALRKADPTVRWSVRNQARMHLRNHDAPYVSSADAMRFWPETATAVAIRRTCGDCCEIAAPFGLRDLFHMVVRPTPRFAATKREIYEDRIQKKDWTNRWPLLRVEV